MTAPPITLPSGASLAPLPAPDSAVPSPGAVGILESSSTPMPGAPDPSASASASIPVAETNASGVPVPGEGSSSTDIITLHDQYVAAPDLASAATADEQVALVREQNRRIRTSVDSTVEGAFGTYRVVGADLTGIGPSRPLVLAVIPSDGAPPNVTMLAPTWMRQVADVSHLNDPEPNYPTVTCTPSSVGVAATAVRCSFSGAVPTGAVLQLGLEKNGSQVLVPVSLNMPEGAG